MIAPDKFGQTAQDLEPAHLAHHADIQQAVGHILSRRHHHAAADMGAVAHTDHRSVERDGLFLCPDADPVGAQGKQRVQNPQDIGKNTTEPSLVMPGFLQHRHIEAQPRHVDEGSAVGGGKVDFAPLAVQQQGEGGLRLGGDAQRLDHVVAGAEGQDAHGGVSADQLRRHLLHGTVPAYGDDTASVGKQRLPRQLGGVAGALGVQSVKGDPPPFQLRFHHREFLQAGTGAGGGVYDKIWVSHTCLPMICIEAYPYYNGISHATQFILQYIDQGGLPMRNAGLILEGGGMRGIYTTGVLDFFMDKGIRFRHVYGVSAGVCHACSYLSGQRGRAMRTVTEYVDDYRYAGMRSLLTTGDYFGVKMIYDTIPNGLIPFDYEAFAASGASLYAVLTNCRTGKAEYLPVKELRRDMVIIRASSSLPLLSRRVKIGGEYYLDGGISDSIPLAKSIEDGNEKNVVILTQHRGYQKGPNKLAPLMRLRYGAPFAESIRGRHDRYNEALALAEREEAAGNAFVIQPGRPVDIGRLEKDKTRLMGLYKQGCDDAAANFGKLECFLDTCEAKA